MKRFLLVIMIILLSSNIIACGASEGKSRYDQMMESTSSDRVKELSDIENNEYKDATDAARAGISYNDYIKSKKQAEENSASGEDIKEVSAAVTPTPKPEPTPTMTPDEAKYEYYNENYITNLPNCTNDSLVAYSLDEAKEILEEYYYSEWYLLVKNSEESFTIDEYTRDGREYGIKCVAIDTETNEYWIYYFYLDDIYVYLDNISHTLGHLSLLDVEYEDRYVSIPRAEYEELRDTYRPYRLDQIYGYCKKVAREKVEDRLGWNSGPRSFDYDDEADVYFEYDGDYTYYVNFNIKCTDGWEFYKYYYRAEFVFTDRDKNHNIELRSCHLEKD